MDFKGSQFEKAIILWGVRWHVAYRLSYRQLQGIRGERGVVVVHFMVIGALAPRSPRITCLYSAPDSIINVSSAIITTQHM
jgi:transposase-like protein